MVEPLNLHYSFTNPSTIHDEEALTSLELAGRTAAKTNEVVKDQNALRTETETHLSAQDETISQRMAAQDNRITIMNDVTMPKEVNEEINRFILAGEFDKAIDLYAGELEKRLNNLLGSVTEGSTSLDAELIDVRTDMFGNSHLTAGQSTRTVSGLLHSMLENISNIIKDIVLPVESVNVPLTMNSGTCIWQDGKYTELSSQNPAFICSEPVDVSGSQLLIIDAAAENMCHFYAFYDTMGNFISGEHSTSEKKSFSGAVYVPSNAVNIRVSGYGEKTGSLNRVVKYESKNDNVTTFVKNIDEFILNGVNLKNTDEIPLSKIDAHMISPNIYGEIIPVASGDVNFKISDFVEVNAGEVLFIEGSAGYSGHYYAFYDSLKNYVCSERASGEVQNFEKYVITPPNAKYLVITEMLAEKEGYKPMKLSKVTSERNNPRIDFSHITWVALGDSLTESNLRTTKNYHDYIHEKTGITVLNHGSSGSGYVRGKKFYNQLKDLENVEFDVITLFGSFNDLNAGVELGDVTDTTETTICGSINKTLNDLYLMHPTVQVGIVSPTPWVNTTPSDTETERGISGINYVAKLEQIAKMRGIPYLDLFHNSGLRPNDETFRNLAYSKDEGNGVHPDETGHKMIASHFYSFLESLIGIY